MKQRLVGVIVVGALALIFLPMLLDGEGIDRSGITSNIPPPPPVPPVPDTTPRRPDMPAPPAPERGEEAGPPAAEQAREETPRDANPAARAADQPALDARGLPEAWSVRLASFARPENASRLVQRLRNQGHKGYSRELASSRGELTAVFVGPVATRGEADALKRRLQSEFNLEGLVVRFAIDQAQPGE